MLNRRVRELGNEFTRRIDARLFCLARIDRGVEVSGSSGRMSLHLEKVVMDTGRVK